jgi:hypothetical protein
MGRAWARSLACPARFTEFVLRDSLEGSMQDLLYVGLTIVVFGVLFLIVKGVERFER